MSLSIRPHSFLSYVIPFLRLAMTEGTQRHDKDEIRNGGGLEG